jgi:hypothetical protein
MTMMLPQLRWALSLGPVYLNYDTPASQMLAGVQILVQSKPYKVDGPKEDMSYSVSVKSPTISRTILCKNILFAAGAETPQLFRDLFPTISINFKEVNNFGAWISISIPDSLTTMTPAAVIFDEIVSHQLEYRGTVVRTANAGSGGGGDEEKKKREKEERKRREKREEKREKKRSRRTPNDLVKSMYEGKCNQIAIFYYWS